MRRLSPGETIPLPAGPWTLCVPGPFDLSVVVLSTDGRVAGDEDLVFFGAPSTGGVRLRGDAVEVAPAGLRRAAERLVLLASPEDGRTPFARLPVPVLEVPGVARFTPASLSRETVVQVAEVYRRGTGWKLRALGAGYADGLAGLAREFGVEVDDDEPGLAGQCVAESNRRRAEHGLAPLAVDARLTAAAVAHGDDMARRGFFAHDSPDGRSVADRVQAAGYAYAVVAENLAAAQRTAAEVVQGWLDSPGHRRNLLSPDVTQIGVAHTAGGAYGTLWTQVFGRPR